MDEDRTMGAADDHLTAAENYLAMAEDGFATIFEEPRHGITNTTTVYDANSKMRVALQFADLHRRMAETYWGYPTQKIEIAHPVPDDQGGLTAAERAVGVPESPCDCCASGLFNADGEASSLCADCGHAGDRHNGNVPVPEFSRGLDAENERRKAVQSLSDQEFEDLLTLAAEERRRRQEENGVQINAREPKPWRSPGGAGQWRG